MSNHREDRPVVHHEVLAVPGSGAHCFVPKGIRIHSGRAPMKPIRIQRKRAKGWKMPPNTVSVCRPGKFGNPFDFRSSECCWLALSYGCRGDRLGRQEASVRAFREWIEPPAKGKQTVRYERGVRFGNDEKNFQIGPRFIVGPPPTIDTVRAELAGKNLACFCEVGSPCHADVLLELANKP